MPTQDTRLELREGVEAVLVLPADLRPSELTKVRSWVWKMQPSPEGAAWEEKQKRDAWLTRQIARDVKWRYAVGQDELKRQLRTFARREKMETALQTMYTKGEEAKEGTKVFGWSQFFDYISRLASSWTGMDAYNCVHQNLANSFPESYHDSLWQWFYKLEKLKCLKPFRVLPKGNTVPSVQWFVCPAAIGKVARGCYLEEAPDRMSYWQGLMFGFFRDPPRGVLAKRIYEEYV